MLSFHKKSCSGPSRKQRGQNMTEYMLMFAAAVAVMVVALNPKGFVTKAVSKSLNMMFDSVEDMVSEPCLGTIDNVNGGWSGWTSWSACAGCVQTRTRGCTNPSPKCNGSPCSGPAAETQACTIVGGWATGACGACTGTCGDTDGSCTRLVTCPSGCCAPPAPVSVMSCTKLAYPDTWSEMGFGACSPTCDEGISSQAVPCSGSCCDAMIKPDTRRACTDGCCIRSLYIGMDVGAPMSGPEDDTPMYADFGPAGPGPFPMPCPPGYTGNPTYTCTATANLSCTGNDSYVPPPSCYSIGWGGFSGECQAGDCGQSAPVDIGYGGHTLMYQFAGANNGGTATVDCTTLTDPNTGAGHTAYLGQLASYDCWLESWLNLNATCIPNCPQEDNVFIGEDLYETFLERWDDTTATLICSSYDAGPNPTDKKYVGSVTRDCGISPLADGQWGSVNGVCDFKPCDGAAYLDANAVVEGWFGSGTKVNPGPPVTHGTTVSRDCATIDNRYTGSFARTCTYGDWMPVEPYGGCAAASCPSWTTTVNSVDVTFAGAGHDTTVTGSWTNNTYNCDAAANCCFGQWFTTSTDCNSVASVDWANNAYSGTCAAYQCTYPFWPSNAQRCYDLGDTSDETGLIGGNVNWSLANGNCTSQKCEYACNATFKKVGNNCEDTVCNGPAPNGAVQCGTQKPLVDTDRWLNSSCSSTTMCEYRCDSANNWYYCSNSSSCYQPRTCSYYGRCSGSDCSYSNGCTANSLCCQSCDCTSPCGNGTIANGWPDTCYSTNSVACGSLCSSVAQTATCNSGNWSSSTFSSYTYDTCDVGTCASCPLPEGGTIGHGLSKTYYSFNQANCNCSSQSRTCDNGTLSGTYTGTTCSGIPCCGDSSCYGPPDYCIGCSCSYMESCKTCSTDCACTTRSFTVAVNNGTQGRTYKSYSFPSPQSQNGCCSISNTTTSCTGWGCECWGDYDTYYSYYYSATCVFYNQTTVNSSADLCSPYSTCFGVTTLTSVNGSGCGNPGTPGSSCTVILSQ